MIDETLLSNEPLDNDAVGVIGGANWQEPPEPGAIKLLLLDPRVPKHLVFIKKFDPERSFQMGKPVPKWLKATLDIAEAASGLTVVYGWQIDSMPSKFRNNQSMIGDLLTVTDAPAPTSLKNMRDILVALESRKTPFPVQIDWEARCKHCGDTALLRVTDRPSAEEAKAFLKSLTSSDDKDEKKKGNGLWDEINKAAITLRKWRDFPEVEGKLVETAPCPVCGAQLRARNRIVRLLKP